MSKKDVLISIIIGVLNAIIWVPVINFLKIGFLAPLGAEIWALVVIIPVVSVAGIYVAGWLADRWAFLLPFAKFGMVGFLNTGIDFAVFNYFIFVTGIEVGWPISFFKAAGFALAIVSGYFWNKYWSFQAGDSGGGGAEFTKYAVISVVGILLNVGSTSLIINLIPPPGGLTQLIWDNIAAVAATIANLVWNFIGYKVIVFKTRQIAS